MQAGKVRTHEDTSPPVLTLSLRHAHTDQYRCNQWQNLLVPKTLLFIPSELGEILDVHLVIRNAP